MFCSKNQEKFNVTKLYSVQGKRGSKLSLEKSAGTNEGFLVEQ